MMNAHATHVTRGILLMVLAVLLFSTMDAVAKGIVDRYPAPRAIRAGFAGQLLIVVVIRGPRPARVSAMRRLAAAGELGC